MSVRRHARVVVVGGAAAQLSIVLRGIVVARLIGPDNMGIATAFFAVMAFIEMLSVTGGDAFLVQQKIVPPREAARTVQSLMLGRGILSSLVLVAIAAPAARSFDAAEAVAGFLAIAAVPLVRGLASVDPIVQQRLSGPGAWVRADVWSQGASLVVGVALAWWLRDWRAVVAALLAQSVVYTIASHAVAGTRWTLGFNREVARANMRFGLPLLGSAVAMFLSQQGDRVMIGVAPTWFGVDYSRADLGRYAVAAAISLLPVRTCARLSRSAFLPWIAKAEGAIEVRRRRRVALSFFAAIGFAYAIFGSTVASDLLEIVVGPKYGDMHLIVAILCTSQAVRLIRFQTNAVSLSLGETKEVLVGSIVRLLGVGLALPAVMLGLPIAWVAAAAIGGEVLSVAASEARLARIGASNGALRFSPTVFALGIVLAAGACMALVPVAGGYAVLGLVMVLAAIGALLARRFRPDLWEQGVRLYGMLRKRRGTKGRQALSEVEKGVDVPN